MPRRAAAAVPWAIAVVALGAACSSGSGGGGYLVDGGPEGGDGASGSSGTGGGAGAGGGAGTGGDSGTGGVAGSGGTGGGTSGASGTGGGGGGPCSTSLDCASPAPICDPLPGECVECLLDTDCAGAARCRDRACQEVRTCVNSLDCTGLGDRTICHPTTKTCEECAIAADCPGTADCVASQCVAYTSCVNSLDCASLGFVCDTVRGRCVECNSTLDCTGSATCVDSVCETLVPCTSDNQCTPLGKLCNQGLGYCVDCLGDGECPTAYHCAAGECAVDVCAAGATRCESGDVVECDSRGAAWQLDTACGSQQSCVEAGAGATCEPWVCQAGQTYCDGTDRVVCAADGLSELSRTDCSSAGQVCSAGACTSQVCSPLTYSCSGGDVVRCNAGGTATSIVDACTSSEHCVDGLSSCQADVCAQGTDGCVGNEVRTCAADGSGWGSLVQDCSSTGQTCVAGACVSGCTAATARAQVRLAEIFVGDPDYIKLRNRASCTAQLSGLVLEVASSAPLSPPTSFPLPSFSLAAGGTVNLVDDTGAASSGEIQVPMNIFMTDLDGSRILLCNGPCSTTGSVLDAVLHQGTDATTGGPPPLPSPLAFSPALTGIDGTNYSSTAFVRVTYLGTNPSFAASDWTTGPKSRP
ncbi:MAG: hypothetical protein IT376_04535 [Polyangiaceae bacterium]|nr:hypothetical protein [Polyangiaceae bacterium]